MARRSISTYIPVILTALLALSSCGKEPNSLPSGEGILTLCLSPCDMELTRAESEYGSEDYNENKITGFKLYFYSENSETAAAKYIYPASGLASLTNEAADGYSTNGLTVDPTSGKVTLSLALEKTVGAALFPSGASQCYVYAVANTGTLVTLPSTAGDAATSKENLKKLSVSAEFGPTTASDPFAEPQADFVMDGSATLTKDADQNISGTVELSRAAAKVTFYVTEVKPVQDKDPSTDDLLGTWNALTDKMHVCYRNAVNFSLINGDTTPAERSGHVVNYTTSQGRLLSPFTTSAGKTNWTHSLPFYSYFDEWTSSSSSDAPYLLLQIPWSYTRAGESTPTRYFTCYYAVPFNSVPSAVTGTCRIDRNTWYKVSLSVSILGSGDPDNPTEILPSYMVLPWGNNPVQTNADLVRYRYLITDRNSFVMNNVNALEIPFYSSHKVTLVSSSMTKTVLKPSSGYKPYETTVPSSDYTLDFDNTSLPGKSKVTFTHALVNDYSADYDVTAYTLTFTFRHNNGDADDANFTETVTITQYPALYVVAELNSDCKYPDSGTSGRGGSWGSRWTNYSNYGYVYVNGARGSSGWTTVSYSGGNKDPYRYVVTVSSLPSGTPFTIGDPRSDIIATLSFTGSGATGPKSAPDIDGSGNRYLSYYYPTDATASQINMIAPVFRIASSYGVTSAISFSDATKRCATYQEDGYPAGRWRIPTQAEIWYMVKLASDEKIPVLLTTTSYYWGGDGYAYMPSLDYSKPTRENTGTYYVRCVYDEWYWTDTCDKTTFTWGDKER